MICDTKEIQFTFLGDASGLSFIDVIDLYTIFANALDNAIEAAEKLESEKRLISIHIAKLGSITNIHIENTCCDARQLRLEENTDFQKRIAGDHQKGSVAAWHRREKHDTIGGEVWRSNRISA